MDAVEYLRQKKKMCDSFDDTCNGCHIFESNPGFFNCRMYEEEHPEKTIRIVEKWAKEHGKTYKQDFLEKFPNAAMDIDGVPVACRRSVYGNECPQSTKCGECWNETMKYGDGE